MSTFPIAVITTLIYCLLAIVGGTIGYRQAGSQMSLISGLISGLLLLIGAYLISGGAPIGPALSAIVSLILVIVFIVRLIKTSKFMPAGLMIIFGIINLATLWVTLPIKFVF